MTEITPHHIFNVIKNYTKHKEYNTAHKYARHFRKHEGFNYTAAVQLIEDAIKEDNKPKQNTNQNKPNKNKKTKKIQSNKEE